MYRILALSCLALMVTACARVPGEQQMLLSSNNAHNLTLGIKSGPRTASFPNDDLFNSDNDHEREPIATHFYNPDTEECQPFGGELGPTSIVFPESVVSLADGTAIVSGFAGNSFPNTQNTLQALRDRFAEQSPNIDLLVRLGTVRLVEGGLTLDGEHAVGGIYEPGQGSFLSFSVIGVPGSGPIPVALTSMVRAKIKYDFFAPETCSGESIVSYPFQGTIGSLQAATNTNDAGIAAVGIALAADTQNRPISYCFVVPGFVGQLNPRDGSDIAYGIGVDGPSGAPNPIAIIRTGGDDIGLTCPGAE